MSDENASGEQEPLNGNNDHVPPPKKQVPVGWMDDSSHQVTAALHARRQMNPALYMNNDPAWLAALSKVRYVDLGFESTREYWMEVAEPAYARFVQEETRGNAIAVFILLWSLPDWLWHEQHPGTDTRTKDYEQFRDQLFAKCPGLAWVRDVADAGKHRGLGRKNVQVREVAKRNYRPLTICLDDGTEHNIADVLMRIVQYFRENHFGI